MKKYKITDIVKVVNADVLPGNEEKPNLTIDDHHIIKDIFIDKGGFQHLDIGLVSTLGYISSYETGEQLPNGDRIHWCHPSRFELIGTKVEEEVKSNRVICPKCLGAKAVMEANETKKGFHYDECSLCNKTGEVTPELAEDYILSLNEENIQDYE